jgi:hypothetical protein
MCLRLYRIRGLVVALSMCLSRPILKYARDDEKPLSHSHWLSSIKWNGVLLQQQCGLLLPSSRLQSPGPSDLSSDNYAR